KRLDSIGEAADLGVLRVVLIEIAEEEGPLVDPLRASDQLVDEVGTLVGRCVGHETRYLSRRRNAAGQVQRGPPDDIVIRRGWSRSDSRGLQRAEHVKVDGSRLGQLVKRVGAAPWGHIR